MNAYKLNTNEEMSTKQEKATKALNELLLLTMSSRCFNSVDGRKHIWEQIDILSAFIYKSDI